MSDSGNPMSSLNIDEDTLKEYMDSTSRSGHPLLEEVQALLLSAIKKRLEKDENKSQKKRNIKSVGSRRPRHHHHHPRRRPQ
jgi:hypothetical protein